DVPFHLQKSSLHFEAVAVVVKGARRVHNAVAWKEQGHGIARHHLAYRARGARTTDLCRHPRVRAYFTRRNLRRGAQSGLFEWREIFDIDLVVVDAPGAEILLDGRLEPGRGRPR